MSKIQLFYSFGYKIKFKNKKNMNPNMNNSLALNLTGLVYAFEFYSCLVIVNIGLVANLLNILVSMRKELQKNTMGFYNVLMSTFNILTLVTVCYLNLFIESLGDEQLILKSNLSCAGILFISRLFPQVASWLNVMVTFDRMICVSRMKRDTYANNKRRLTLIVAGICMVLSGINAPNLFFSLKTQATLNLMTNITRVETDCKASNLLILIRDMVSAVMRIFLPLVLQASMNALLIYKLYSIRRRVESSQMTSTMKRDHKFAFTIIVLNVIAVITEFPVIVCLAYINVYGYSQSFIVTTSNQAAIASFAYLCTMVLSSFTYVALFFVNVVTNKLFRRECSKLIFCVGQSVSNTFSGSARN